MEVTTSTILILMISFIWPIAGFLLLKWAHLSNLREQEKLRKEIYRFLSYSPSYYTYSVVGTQEMLKNLKNVTDGDIANVTIDNTIWMYDGTNWIKLTASSWEDNNDIENKGDEHKFGDNQ